MELTIKNMHDFILFLKLFMNMPIKKQLDIIEKLEKELNSKCSK